MKLKSKLLDIRDIAFGIPAAFKEYLMTQPIVAVLGTLAIVLFIVFFSLLGTLNPSSPGQEVPLGQVLTAAKQRQIASATILDEDARIEVMTRAGQQVWAAYPKSEGQTSRLIDGMQKAGAEFDVDQQSGKSTKR